MSRIFRRNFAFILLLLLSLNVTAEILNPIKWKVSKTQTEKNEISVFFEASIDDSWHLYDISLPSEGPVPTSFVYSSIKNVELKGKMMRESAFIEKKEPSFDNLLLKYYEKRAVFLQKFIIKDGSKPYSIKGKIEYMCCNDMQCLPPTQYDFAVKGIALSSETKPSPTKSVDSSSMVVLPDTTAQEDNKTIDSSKTNIAEFSTVEGTSGNSSLLSIFLSGLLGGFLAILTPCVWPIIPMTVSFFLKKSENKTAGRYQAVVYGLSIILIYLSFGLLLTAIFDASTLNALSTNAYFNIFLFLLLLVFAISFLGGFNIELPASWSSAIDNKADKTSGLLGVLLMAVTLVIVSFSCTGPIIGTLLVNVASKGDLLGPAVGMFGFALALAIPFTFFAFFPTLLKKLPRSGNWLNVVKVLLGFFELAFSLKFFSVADQAYGWHLLSRTTFIAIWIAIFVFAGLYLLGKIVLPNDTKTECVSVPRLLISLTLFAFAIYLIPGLFGAPLNIVSAFAPPIQRSDASLYTKTVNAQTKDFDEAVAIAKQTNKPILVDFTGYGCVNCRKMESSVWTDPQVQQLLNGEFILVSLYVDDKTALPSPIKVQENGKTLELSTVGEKWSYLQRNKFGANAQPFYITMDKNENLLNHSFSFTENPDEFSNYLKESLKNIK